MRVGRHARSPLPLCSSTAAAMTAEVGRGQRVTSVREMTFSHNHLCFHSHHGFSVGHAQEVERAMNTFPRGGAAISPECDSNLNQSMYFKQQLQECLYCFIQIQRLYWVEKVLTPFLHSKKMILYMFSNCISDTSFYRPDSRLADS